MSTQVAELTTHVSAWTEKGVIGFRVWNHHVLDDMKDLWHMLSGSAFLTLTIYSTDPDCESWTYNMPEVTPCT